MDLVLASLMKLTLLNLDCEIARRLQRPSDTNTTVAAGRNQLATSCVSIMAPKTPKGEVVEGRQQSPAQTMVVSCLRTLSTWRTTSQARGWGELHGNFSGNFEAHSRKKQMHYLTEIIHRVEGLLSFLRLVLSNTSMVSFSFLKAVTSKMQ